MVSVFLLMVTFSASSASEGIPRVLIIGDSVYQGPARRVAKELQGRAVVVFAPIKPGQVRNSKTALTNVDTLLGRGRWDLIHFNLGLGDLVYRAPRLKSFRALPKQAGGILTTSPQQYEKNLRQLVKRLKRTGAKLIWASTTPIRSSSTNLFEPGSAKRFNLIADQVMKQEQVPINDMYKYVKSVINMKRPTAADPFSFDRKPIHQPIVDSIVRALGLRGRRD